MVKKVKLYTLYEKVDIELPGKLITKYIINQSSIIKEVILGYYKLLPEIFLSNNPEEIIVLFKDI